MIAVALGLICWLVTKIVTESELCRPVRDWLDDRADLWDDVRSEEPASRRVAVVETVYRKACYLASCCLCAGVWIALVMTAFVDYRLPTTSGWSGFVLTALLIKAIAHAAHALLERVAR